MTNLALNTREIALLNWLLFNCVRSASLINLSTVEYSVLSEQGIVIGIQ